VAFRRGYELASQSSSNFYHLSDRALLRVAGDDARIFLQNIITNDVPEEGMNYACLLTPQGQLLHEFFVFPDETGGYFLDCDRAGRADLARRLGIYKLRSKISISEEAIKIYAQSKEGGLADPRLPDLGYRVYTKDKIDALTAQDYYNFCISLGVPPLGAIRAGRDFLSNVNLDLLNAVSFDKGCFVGQELVARIEHRGLVKKRLFIVEGEGLAAGDALLQGGVDIGEIRIVDTTARRGLAVVKLEAVDSPVIINHKSSVKIIRPPYLLGKS
jgi:folate-binding protein YgfZ